MSNVKVGDLLYWPDTARLGMVRALDIGVANNIYVEFIPEYFGIITKERAAEAKKALDKLRETW